MLLAIDVGNTRIKVWNVLRGGFSYTTTREVTDTASAKKLLQTVHGKELTIVGCSVVPRVTDLINGASQQLSGRDPVWINAAMELGIPIKYETPETLGADRLANALAAVDQYSPPIIVVDIGTATKLEAIDKDGNYLGGSILPGILMGLRSLSNETAQLPQLTPHWPLDPFGNETESSIMTGCVRAHAHSIVGLIKDYEERIGHAQIVITGRDRTLLLINDRSGPFKGMNVEQDEWLTLKGLGVAAKRLGLST